MKKLILFFLSAIIFQLAQAQREDLFVKSSNQGLYLEHKVGAKQGLFAIGRLYNVHPKHIAAFNKMDLNAGLSIDQVLRIPLTDTNFIQKGYTGTPVYYRVGNTGETLQKISSVTKNVPTQLIKEWNNLKGDIPRSGVKLVVGFLQSNEMPSITITPAVKKDEVVKTEVKETPKTEAPKTVVKEEPKKEEPKAIVKEEPKKEEPKAVVKEEPKKEDPKAIVKEEPKKEEPKPVLKETPKKEEAISVSNPSTNSIGGYFRTSFEQQVRIHPVSKNLTATSGIFKTTSGVQDAKYYLLIDNVTPGTIVRIINPENNAEVYAKVLGEMSGIRQNEGLDIRMSNAAASALQISEQDKFIVKVVY